MLLHYNIFIFETTTFWTNEVVTKIFEATMFCFIMHMATNLANILLFHNFFLELVLLLNNSICLFNPIVNGF